MSPEERLASLGITLPEAPKPLGSYVPFLKTGGLAFLSGMLPIKDGKLIKTGKLGRELTIEEGVEAARAAVINALAAARAGLGGLDKVKRCIKLTGYVASDPSFTAQPQVLNAASGLLADVFGEAGRHTRVAIGVSVLPLDSPVELELVLEVKE
ncbi:MAG: RidA family protein [Nitrospiraceae bacterium]|nr:RidA family protein [Nitrospiraceae bacterium]